MKKLTDEQQEEEISCLNCAFNDFIDSSWDKIIKNIATRVLLSQIRKAYMNKELLPEIRDALDEDLTTGYFWGNFIEKECLNSAVGERELDKVINSIKKVLTGYDFYKQAK